MTIKLFLFLSSKLCCLCTLVIFQTKNSFGSSPVESRTSKFGPKSQNAQLTTPCMSALINCRYKHDQRYSISGQCSSLTGLEIRNASDFDNLRVRKTSTSKHLRVGIIHVSQTKGKNLLVVSPVC